MLHARLLIDLPREPLPRSGAITRLLLSLVSDPGPDEDRDRLLGDALETLRTTLHAFGEAGVDDVVVLRVGDEVIYADDEQRLDDADQALARVVASGRLQRGFGSLRVVLSHRGEGLHTVVQIELDEEVVRAIEEVPVAGSVRSMASISRPPRRTGGSRRRCRAARASLPGTTTSPPPAAAATATTCSRAAAAKTAETPGTISYGI